MEPTTALAILIEAVERCRTEDVRTIEVFAALHYLAARIPARPFDEFRKSLDVNDRETRYQKLMTALHAIKLLVRPGNKRRSRILDLPTTST
jgi:hypothetical protein